MQVELQVQALRGAFLDEVGIAHAFFDGGDEAQPALRGAGDQALFLKGAPSVGNAFAQGGLGTDRAFTPLDRSLLR